MNNGRIFGLALAVARRGALAKLLAVGGAAAMAVVVLALLLCGWLAVVASRGAAANCASPAAVGTLRQDIVPPQLVPLFTDASARYRLGQRGPAVLAALTKIESDFGRNLGPSSAGAVGWTQFLPTTWARYGVDADRDGKRDPNTAADAIHAAARYLAASGAPTDWRRALLAYNHADWYVTKVLRQAEHYEGARAARPISLASCASDPPVIDGSERLVQGGGIVPIPGAPGELIDARVLPDLLLLIRRFNVKVTDGYARTGHAPDGEHPLGLAVDLVPGPGGTWADIDRLARWAEPRQNQPRPPWRWVGWTGDANHGWGDHLHLSWNHGPAPGWRPPACWVSVLARGEDR